MKTCGKCSENDPTTTVPTGNTAITTTATAGSGKVEVDIDIGPGFQSGLSSEEDSQNSNFDSVSQTAQELQDKIREDKLPKDQGSFIFNIYILYNTR